MCQSTQNSFVYCNQQCKFEQTPIIFFRRTRCYDVWQDIICHYKYWRRLQSFTAGRRGTSALPTVPPHNCYESEYACIFNSPIVFGRLDLATLTEWKFRTIRLSTVKLSQWVYCYLWLITSAYILCSTGGPIAYFIFLVRLAHNMNLSALDVWLFGFTLKPNLCQT